MGERQRLLCFVGAALFFIVATWEVIDDGFGVQAALSAMIGGSLFGLGLLRGRQRR